MINVAYVHSKICEALLFEAQNSGHFELDAVIYGRNYSGCFSCPSITFSEDQIDSDISLLAYSIIFSKFLLKLEGASVRLILPHSFNPLFRVFASHKSVVEVYYMEEGDLSYSPTSRLSDNLSDAPRQLASAGLVDMLRKIGYSAGASEIYAIKDDGWFFDMWGKYAGSIVSNQQALSGFCGKRIFVQLGVKKIFNKKTGILLVTNFDEILIRIRELLQANSLKIVGVDVKSILVDVIKKLIAEHVAMYSDLVDQWYYKWHPSLADSDARLVLDKIPESYISWQGSEAEYLSRGVDISYLNFDIIASIGNTSAERYARNAHGDSLNFCVIEHKIIIKEVFSCILSALQMRLSANRGF